MEVVLHRLVLAVGGWTTVGLLHLRGEIARAHLSIHRILRRSDRLLVVICSTKATIGVRVVIASIWISNWGHLTRLDDLVLSR